MSMNTGLAMAERGRKRVLMGKFGGRVGDLREQTQRKEQLSLQGGHKAFLRWSKSLELFKVDENPDTTRHGERGKKNTSSSGEGIGGILGPGSYPNIMRSLLLLVEGRKLSSSQDPPKIQGRVWLPSG